MFQKNDEGINKRDRFYAHGQLIFAVGHRICMWMVGDFYFPLPPHCYFYVVRFYFQVIIEKSR